MTTGSINMPFTGPADQYGNKTGEKYAKTWSGGDGCCTPHPYNMTADDWHAPFVSVMRIFPVAYQVLSAQSIAGPYQVTLPDPYNKALNKLYGKVKGADWSAAVAASQLPQSVKMIAQDLFKLGRAYRAAKRGDFWKAAIELTGNGKGPGGKASRNWLELQYGWLPLLSDIYSACETADHLMRHPKLRPIRARAREKGEMTNNNLVTYAKRKQWRGVNIVYYPTAELSLDVALGLNDPASVAWELLPWSFVVDWALPIGPWLSAMTASRSMSGLTVVSRYGGFEYSDMRSGNYYIVLSGGGLVRRKQVNQCVRSVGSAPPSAVLPSFTAFNRSLSGDVAHVLNALALLGSRR